MSAQLLVCLHAPHACAQADLVLATHARTSMCTEAHSATDFTHTMRCRRASAAGHSGAMLALGHLRQRASRSEDGTVVNLKQWREAQHWYIEAATNGNKAALEALGMLYQTDDSRHRGDEAVELLIRSSSDPHLPTSSDTTTAKKKHPGTGSRYAARL